MKKIISVILAAVLLLMSLSVSAFALTKDEANANLTAQHTAFNNIVKSRLSVKGNDTITAADARAVLLLSAGITEEGVVSANADLDGDGKVTAIDARCYLRVAAGLDDVANYYTDAEIFNYYLAIVNSIKPNRTMFFKSTRDATQKVTVKDSKGVVNRMNTQMNNLAALDDSMGVFDLEAEIKAIEGDTVFPDGSTYLSALTATSNSFPLSAADKNEFACVATLTDIKDIVYKKNQTFTYTKYSRAGSSLAQQTITGLDSITIYLKDDNAVAIEDDMDDSFENSHAAKAFNLLNTTDIHEIINNYSFDNSFDGLGDYGECEINIKPKTLAYCNSYITVYFDPATGTPMGYNSNLGYRVDMNMDMFIDFDDDYFETDNILMDATMKILLLQITSKNNGKLLYVDGDFDVVNDMSVNVNYYFFENNPNNTLQKGSLI